MRLFKKPNLEVKVKKDVYNSYTYVKQLLILFLPY